MKSPLTCVKRRNNRTRLVNLPCHSGYSLRMKPSQLNITNGDNAANTMKEAGIPGVILPWRDILHDGPVPGGVDLDALAPIRARFLAQPPVATREQILQDIRQRDDTLKDFRQYDRVVIWLEHDLYDQLQLLQLLNWFAEAAPFETPLFLININQFPGIQPFYGLGQLTAPQMASLAGSEQPVTKDQLALGQRAWLAFTSNTPLPLQELTGEDLSPLPFLQSALLRHLEEFPDVTTGLSRHERQILEMVDKGKDHPFKLFAGHQHLEKAPYLGDWGFWSLIERLTNTENALLQTATREPFIRPPNVPADEHFRSQSLRLTGIGRSVLRGEADWVKLNPPDCWKGGVHLHPDNGIWRWNSKTQRFT